jgi:hypothetical protein
MGWFGRKKKVDEGVAFNAWDTGGTDIPLSINDGKEKYANDQSRHNPITTIVVKQLTGKTPLNGSQVAMIFSGQLSIVRKGEKILDGDRTLEIVGLFGSAGVMEFGLITDKTAWSLLDGYVPPPPEEPTYTVDEVKATEWLEKGNELWKSDKHEEAMSCYDKVITMFPESALAWDNKGRLAHVMKLYDLSIECMEQVMRFQEKHYDPLYLIGYNHNAMNNHEKTIEYCDKAIAIWPLKEKAWDLKVVALKKLGREDDVKKCQEEYEKVRNMTTTEEAQEFMKSQKE